MINAETLLIDYLNGHGFPPASLEVPAHRPERFITVERTGGSPDPVTDHPSVAIQTWASSRFEASKLAAEVIVALEGLVAVPEVARVEIDAFYNFPDPVSDSPRYQIMALLVIKS